MSLTALPDRVRAKIQVQPDDGAVPAHAVGRPQVARQKER